jgi:hypothetical protein
MKRAPLLPLAALLSLTACVHAEDRRWESMATGAPSDGDRPTVTVYAFDPPKPGGAKTSVRDLDGEGQAALIEAIAADPDKAAALRKAVAAPLEGEGGGGRVDRSRLARTIVISVAKGEESQPGDRLMRTVVTLTPRPTGGEAPLPFEFAGYSIVATDTKVQSIAKLETSSSASLSASIAPSLGPLGDGELGGELGRTHKTSADIAQQYENLGVDITPGLMSITRESERGLDVVGNTLVALTLAAPADADGRHSAFLAGTLKLYDKGKRLTADDATVEAQPFNYLARCDLEVDVTLRYQLRRIVGGREYYTEGKQAVEIVTETVNLPPQTLVRAADAQGSLFQILDERGSALLAAMPGSEKRRLLLDSFDDAKRLANWLSAEGAATVGEAGTLLSFGAAPPRKGAALRASFYSVDCAAPKRERLERVK